MPPRRDTTEASPPPKGKFMGLGTGGLIVVSLVAVGAVIFLMMRRNSANQAAATQTGTSTEGTPAGTTYPDWSGEISVLQTEIGDLQGELAEQEQDLTEEEKEDRRRHHHRREQGNDHDQDDEKRRCPKGYHFMAVPAGSDIFPAGGRRVKGGFCVPDRHRPKHKPRQPVLTSPRK